MASCAGKQLEQVHYTDKEGVNIVSNLHNGESYVMSPYQSDDFTCRSPAPDVLAALSVSDTFSLIDKSAGANDAFSAESFGGRSPEVLITRELMARLCELTSNIKLTNAQVLTIYSNTISKITDMVKTVAAEQGSVASGYVGNASQAHANPIKEPDPASGTSGSNTD